MKRASRVRSRLLASVAGPVAFVALGASLLVYAHARAFDVSARESDASELVRGVFDLVGGDGEGRKEAIEEARAHGIQIALDRDPAGFAAQHTEDGETLLTVPLDSGHAIVRFATTRLSPVTGVYDVPRARRRRPREHPRRAPRQLVHVGSLARDARNPGHGRRGRHPRHARHARAEVPVGRLAPRVDQRARGGLPRVRCGAGEVDRRARGGGADARPLPRVDQPRPEGAAQLDPRLHRARSPQRADRGAAGEPRDHRAARPRAPDPHPDDPRLGPRRSFGAPARQRAHDGGGRGHERRPRREGARRRHGGGHRRRRSSRGSRASSWTRRGSSRRSPPSS